MKKLKTSKFNYGGELETKEKYVSAVVNFLNKNTDSKLKDSSKWNKDIDKEFVKFLKSPLAKELAVNNGVDFKSKIVDAQKPKTELEIAKQKDLKRIEVNPWIYGEESVPTIKRKLTPIIKVDTTKQDQKIKKDIVEDYEESSIGSMFDTVANGFGAAWDKYIGGSGEINKEDKIKDEFFTAGLTTPIKKKEIDQKYQLLHDTILSYDPYVRKGANFFLKQGHSEYIPTYKAIGTSYERNLSALNAEDQTSLDKKKYDLVTKKDLKSMEKLGYRYTGNPEYNEATGSVIPLLDQSLASGYQHQYYKDWLKTVKDNDVVQVADKTNDGDFIIKYKQKKDVSPNEVIIKNRIQSLSDLENNVITKNGKEFFNFQNSKGTYSNTPYVSSTFPIPAGPKTKQLQIPLEDLKGASRFRGAMVGMYTTDKKGNIIDHGQMSGGITNILKKARQIKEQTGYEPNVVLYDAGSVSGSIASPDGWGKEQYDRLSSYNPSTFGTPTLLATKTPTRRVIFKNLENNTNDTLFFNTKAPKTEKELELFKKQIIKKQGGKINKSKDKEIVNTAIVDIKQIKDMKNRKDVFLQMIQDFEKKGVEYNKKDFKKRANVFQNGGSNKEESFLDYLSKVLSTENKEPTKLMNTNNKDKIKNTIELNKNRKELEALEAKQKDLQTGTEEEKEVKRKLNVLQNLDTSTFNVTEMKFYNDQLVKLKKQVASFKQGGKLHFTKPMK